MPYKCCILECNGNRTNGPKVHVFSFPSDPVRRKKWIEAVNRENFSPSKYSRVCELHFVRDHIIWSTLSVASQDSKTGCEVTCPSKCRLHPDAVPCQFPNSSKVESLLTLVKEETVDVFELAYEEGLGKAMIKKEIDEAVKKDFECKEGSLIHSNAHQVFIKDEILDDFRELVSKKDSKGLKADELQVKDEMNKQDELSTVLLKVEPSDLGVREASSGSGILLELKTEEIDIKSELSDDEGAEHWPDDAEYADLPDTQASINELAEPEEYQSVNCPSRHARLNNCDVTHLQPPKAYTCNKCSFATKYKDSLKFHLLRHVDPADLTLFSCDVCSFKTKHKKYMKRHLITHKAPAEVIVYECKTCSFKTKSRYYIKSHWLIHKNPSEIKWYTCDVCSYKTKFKSSLKPHSGRHKDPLEIKWYTCDVCSYKTKFKSSLKAHSDRHKDPLEIKWYTCDVCSFKTKLKSSLKAHSDRHKDPLKLAMYECEMCSFKSIHSYSFKLHSLIHKSPARTKVYRCNFCLYKTKRLGAFKNHLLAHKDKYSCKQCSFVSKTCQSLAYHLLTHVKSPESEVSDTKAVYSCIFCSFKAEDKGAIILHIQQHKVRDITNCVQASLKCA